MNFFVYKMRHLTEKEITGYFSGAQPAAELLRFDDHLRECKDCAARMSSIASENSDALPDFLQEPAADFHLDYDQLAGYVDCEIDDVDREIVDVHTKGCKFCADQLNEILALREQLVSGEALPLKEPTRPPASLLSFLFRIAVPAFGFVVIALVVWALWPSPSSKQEDVAAAIPEPSLLSTNAFPEPSVAENETAVISENTNKNSAVVKLLDGSSTVELLPDGSVTGVEPAFEARIAKILKGGDIAVDDSARQMRSSRGVLMGANEPAKSFSVNAPVGKILLTDRPEFRWNAVKDADSYEVNIYDSNFNPVATSGPLKSIHWRPSRSLKRGNVYQWQVTADVGGEKIKSPVQPAGPAKFKIVDSAKAAEITRARSTRPNQHLTLGILYAEAGLIDDAISEFEQLARANPDSELPKKILKQVRSRR